MPFESYHFNLYGYRQPEDDLCIFKDFVPIGYAKRLISAFHSAKCKHDIAGALAIPITHERQEWASLTLLSHKSTPPDFEKEPSTCSRQSCRAWVTQYFLSVEYHMVSSCNSALFILLNHF